MQLLEERILKDGKVFPGNVLKVDSFLNHQVDVELINEIGKEFYRLFKDCGVNKIFTRRRSSPLPTARRMTLSSRRNSLIRMIEFL